LKERSLAKIMLDDETTITTRRRVAPFVRTDSDPVHSEAKPISLRQRHKIDKHERIAAAATLLFGQDGYEGTTLRDIAREADVALGTLSLYARDKRDLVLMIFNKVIPPLLDSGRRNAQPSRQLVDNLAGLFEPCYVSFAANITLYRTVLGQIYNGSSSMIAEENDQIRLKVLGYVADIIKIAITSGQCGAENDVAAHSRALFYIYFTAIRVWLFREKPVPHQGLSELRLLFELHVRGMALPPKAAATTAKRRSRTG
jgi:AcrR family transcriptional regulator